MNTTSSDLFISLDQGGHATRAIVFDGGGEKRGAFSHPIDMAVNDERVEIDAGSLMESFRVVLKQVFEDLGPEASSVRRIGLATQRSNIACWHRDTGEPLAPVLSWQDRRAPGYLEGLDADRVHQITGLFPNAHYGASKLAWCRDNIDAVGRAAADGSLCCGPMASFVAAELTGGGAAADPVNASRTMLWSLEDADWDPVLCRHFGLDPSWLPPCVPSNHAFGNMSRRLLPDNADFIWPLSVVTGDLSAAAFARGRPAGDTLYITLGTGAFMQRVEDDARTLHPRLLNGVLWRDGSHGTYSLEGTVNGAGSALGWFADSVGMSPDALHERLAGYDPSVESLPLFLNGVSGLGSPFWAPLENRFIGEGGTDDKGFAVIESIAFLLMENYRAMDTVLASPARVVVSGGLSRVDGLCRALAALTGIPVERSNESEGTAKGLAYLLAGKPGDWPVQQGDVFDPAPCRSLQRRYRNWARQLAEALSG